MYIELPDVGREVSINEPIAVIESVKAASDIYAPLGGVIVEVNNKLDDEPTLVNSSPYSAGWLFKIQVNANVSEVTHLVDIETYQRDYVE